MLYVIKLVVKRIVNLQRPSVHFSGLRLRKFTEFCGKKKNGCYGRSRVHKPLIFVCVEEGEV